VRQELDGAGGVPRWLKASGAESVTESPETAATCSSSHCRTYSVPRSPRLSCRVSGTTSLSPTFQPETACSRRSAVCPASGSAVTRLNVGVLTAPCMRTVPRPMMPWVSCSGSRAVSIGWSMMTTSAVTSAGTGASGVPISSRPASNTVIVPTVRRVSALVRNVSAPSTSMHAIAASLTTS